TTAASWVPGGLAAQLLFQGGIDLSYALGGGALPCFSSFLEETRSSQSTSAVLKDFLIGGFPVCALTISKSCGTGSNGAPLPALTADGTQVIYNWVGSVHNSGVGTLSSVQVNDTLPGGSVVSHPTLSSNTLAPGATATFTATATLTILTAANLTATNTATALGFFGTTEIDSKAPAASASCHIDPSTTVSVVKHCSAPGPGLTCSGSGCIVQVPIRAQVCNLGSVKLLNIGLTDSPSATLIPSTISSLDPVGTVDSHGQPTDCADVTGSYQPTAYDATSDGSTNGRFTFTDVISITSATPAIAGTFIPVPHGCPAGALACSAVSCPLCSSGECSGALP
ncbi:MAG TPA: hypothetical protein VF865_11295, partial [Acidobacteriaceae bacterium]